MNRIIYPLLVLSISTGLVHGQAAKYPFPQSVKYPYGVQSTIVTSDFVQKWYDAWKKKYLQECNGNLRPGVDPLSKSLVEAQGFAMIAVAYMGDKDVFDKLYNFYKSKCTTQGCGMMGWKNSCSGIEDNGSASDGDIDVACGLVVANWQWPGTGYDDKLKAVLKNIERVLVNCSGKTAIAGGCSGSPWGGCNETDISYYEPAFFRYFAEVSGNQTWAKLADDTHLIRDAAANSSTGLVPDWQYVDGRAGGDKGRKNYFSYDAIRAPYKQSLDYIWNGNEKAQAWCKKISTWAHGVGPKNLVDGYQLNGSAQGSNRNLAVEGSLACAAMANTQEVLDDFAKEAIVKKDDYWYSGYLGNLYLLALSGNMWNPDIVDNKITSVRGTIRFQSSAGNLTLRTVSGGSLVVSGLNQSIRKVALTNLAGREVASSAQIQEGKTTLDISSIIGGCYILSTVNENGRGENFSFFRN